MSELAVELATKPIEPIPAPMTTTTAATGVITTGFATDFAAAMTIFTITNGKKPAP